MLVSQQQPIEAGSTLLPAILQACHAIPGIYGQDRQQKDCWGSAASSRSTQRRHSPAQLRYSNRV